MRTAFVAAVLAALVSAPQASACDSRIGAGAGSTHASYTAKVLIPGTVVRSGPGSGVVLGHLATALDEIGHAPMRLLVLDEAAGTDGRCWLQAELPQRPNGRTGWVLADNTFVTKTVWRIEIDIASRALTARRDGVVVRTLSVDVGAAATPTPRGLFHVLWARHTPGGPLGPWILPISAHSNVLQQYAGGPGRIALHSKVAGSHASHGCVRLDSAAIEWLVATIGRIGIAGVPVAIH